jgi:uncharacterized DUF497 family protein
VPYLFEWSPEKAAENWAKHGITFDEGTEVFGDPLSLSMRDPDHSMHEDRYLVMGLSQDRRLLVVSYAMRGQHTRIISVRLASRSERRRYEEDSTTR